jgi:hypothetical protein
MWASLISLSVRLEVGQTMSIDRRQFSAIVLVILAGAAASVLMFWITDYGPGVSPDSVTYIETARSLLAGNGFYVEGKPMTHFAPVYPLLLAMAGLFQHGDILQAGRLLGALFFGANLALFGLAVQIGTEHSWSATGCAILFFLCSAPIISTHSMAWSEAPLITFALAAFVLLSFHVVRPSRYVLLAASLCVGCAMATRYVGITLLPPVICGLFFADRPLKHKIGDTFLVATVASIPLAFWLIRNIVTVGTATDRSLAVHVFGLRHAAQLIGTMYDFVLPLSIPGWTKILRLVVAAVLFLVTLALLRRKNYIENYIRRHAHAVHLVLPALCTVFCFTYISFLVISVSFFDAHTPLNHRILLPAFLFIVVAGISLAWSLSSALDSRIVWYAFILFVLLSVTINGAREVAVVVDTYRNGSGYTSRQWQNSETIAAVISLPKDMEIYSNGQDAIQFLTGRAVTNIPLVAYPGTLQLNQYFEEELQVICREVIEGEAIVVYLNGITWRWYLPTRNELESKCTMPVLARLDDGAIYARPKAQAEQGAGVP